jgi:hypothetical protein
MEIPNHVQEHVETIAKAPIPQCSQATHNATTKKWKFATRSLVIAPVSRPECIGE